MMKSIFKISSMNNIEDVSNIRNAISNMEGVIACQVSLDKKEVNIVYDDFFNKEEDLIQAIEDVGYSII